jgi:hypothetical protein
MSKKISIQEKRRWLELYEQGKTEVQIAREVKRDPRTIVKGLEEASKDRRLASVEAEMLRNALFKHQDQLTAILKNMATMLVMPPHNLELHEEKEGILAPISLSGALLKQDSGRQIILEIHDEDKLEWELLKEHLKQDELWHLIEQWRKALIDYASVIWQFKQAIKSNLLRDIDLTSLKCADSKQLDNLLRKLVDLFHDVTTQKILGTLNKTEVRSVIDSKLTSYDDTAETRDKLVSIFDALPGSIEASKVKSTYEQLASITKLAKRQVDEILLLGMVPGKCRVCRRLGR